MAESRSENKPGVFVGWISEEWGVAWVVSPHRKDKRTGAVNRRPGSAYMAELLAFAVPWAGHPKPAWTPEEWKRSEAYYRGVGERGEV